MNLLLKRILLAFAFIIAILVLVAAYAYFIEPSRLVVHSEDIENSGIGAQN